MKNRLKKNVSHINVRLYVLVYSWAIARREPNVTVQELVIMADVAGVWKELQTYVSNLFYFCKMQKKKHKNIFSKQNSMGLKMFLKILWVVRVNISEGKKDENRILWWPLQGLQGP